MALKSRDDPENKSDIGLALEKALERSGKRKEEIVTVSEPVTAELSLPEETLVSEKPADEVAAVQPAVEESTPLFSSRPAMQKAQPQGNFQEAAKPIKDQEKGQYKMSIPNTIGGRLNSMRSVITRGSSSKRATELRNKMQETIEAAFSNSDDISQGWNIVVLDHSVGLSFPVILVTWTCTDEKRNSHTTAFSILVEPDDYRMLTRHEKQDNLQFEIIVTLGDIYRSDEFGKLVETNLRRDLRLAETTAIRQSGAVVVHNSLVLDDTKVQEIVFQAVNANAAVMDRLICVFDTPPFSVLNRDQQAERLVGRVQFNNKSLADTLDQPYRADLLATVDSTRTGTQSQIMLGQTTVSTLSAYVEPLFSQPSTDPTRPNRPFLPLLVITSLQAGKDQTDAESMLFSLANGVQMISYRNTWVDQYRRRLGQDGATDIGGLGLMMAGAKRYESHNDDFRANFDSFIREHFETEQGMVVAIDVPDVGPNAWLYDLFKACAANDSRAIAAYATYCDNLTGNKYSELASAAGLLGQSPVVSPGERRHAGYYTAEDGTLRDIRDVDLLAVANLRGAASVTLDAYVESCAPVKGSADTRAADRYAVIDDLLQGRQVITGMYTRLYFNKWALPLLARALQEAKLMISPASMTNGLGSAQRMGGFDFGGLLSTSANAALFGAGADTSTHTARW